MACLGPQTASQIMPVEVPSAAGRGTSEGHFREGLPSAAGRGTSKQATRCAAPKACAGISDLNLLFLRSTASRAMGPRVGPTERALECPCIARVLSITGIPLDTYP